MKIRSPLLNKIAGTCVGLGLRVWLSTLDSRVAYYDPSLDPAHCDPAHFDPTRTRIYLVWHENMLWPVGSRGKCNVSMLMSKHRDADLLTQLAEHFDFDFVRGSTARGGDKAMRELIRRSREQHLTITPDGPRGPRRRMAPGPIFLASRLQMPLVLLGIGHDRPWRLPTWDRFAVPRPFSRTRIVFSPEIHLPKRLDRDGLEHYRIEMQSFLTRLSDEAEAWAASESSKLNDVDATVGPHPKITSQARILATPQVAGNGEHQEIESHWQDRAA